MKIELLNKEKLSEVADEVIDLLRKKHHLSPLECAFVLDNLLESLEETMAQLFHAEIKIVKDNPWGRENNEKT